MSFHKKRFAQEYEKRLTEEGYPGNLLEIVMSEVKGSSSIIDIGSGTGFFSIPLLEKGYWIIAIEPSVEMISIFKSKIRKDLLPLLRLYNEEWESWQGENADTLICIHSIYGMNDIKQALQKMKKHAVKSILTVKADSGRRTLSSIIRERIKEIGDTSGFYSRIIQSLKELGIEFNSKLIEQKRNSYFHNIVEEAEYYCYHLGLEKDNLNTVEEIIRENSEEYDNGYIFKSKYRDNLITF